MTNLTPSEARRLIDKLHHNQTKEHGISILEEKYLAALEIALPVLEQKLKPCERCNGTGEMDSGGTNSWGDPILVECDCKHAPQEPEQPEGQFFLVEHDSGYEVETTLHAAMQRQADFGGRIWALTGSIVKPKTDTYRQIENDGGQKCWHKHD